jgi:hypothetical protein
MPPEGRHLPPGYVVTYPNREKLTSRLLKLIVVGLLLLSVALMLAITIGGWSKLQGLTWLNFAYCIVYGLIAVMVARWARGLLPIAAAFAILLLIIALIAGFGGSGTSWFQRSHLDYTAPQSLFGGSGLSPDTLGVLVFAIAPVQVLLIVFAMQGFAQGWNVEVEKHVDELEGRRGPARFRVRHGAAPRGAAHHGAAHPRKMPAGRRPGSLSPLFSLSRQWTRQLEQEVRDVRRRPEARREGILSEELDGELLLYDVSTNVAHALAPVAATVWRSCDGRARVP